MMLPVFLLLLLPFVNADLITNLPGAPNVNFKQYAGYFDVGNNRHFHYWFVESQSNPATDPVLLWLTGGPGCSGLSALLTEFGPFMVNPDGATLSLNPYSWNKKASILTIESPAGVGYSYSSNGDIQTDDNQTANANFNALKGFFTAFPQYKSNDFFVTGESYGGIYIPTLVQTILNKKQEFPINLKGMAIGNGCVSGNLGLDTIIQFTYNHGMIDEQTWQKVSTQCCDGKIDGCAFHSINGFGYCPSFINEASQNAWYSGINPYNMYANCYNDNKKDRPLQKRYEHDYFMRTGRRLPDNFESIICLDERPVTTYLQRKDVRQALFVPDNLPAWEICSEEVSYTYGRIYSEMQSRVQQAANAGVRVLLYNGDVDMACNFLMGQRFSDLLGFTKTQTKTHFKVNGQIGGYHTQYDKVEYVSVRGAGHMVPTDKPDVAFHIIDAFLQGKRP